MVKVKDDLCITVPTLFRCPISLDLMKSPVSLSTGVTYDRSSIQRWLDAGNNTCPATMQVLQSKDFVPNRTLRNLIQIWSDSVSNRVDSSELPSLSIPSKDQVTELIRKMESNQGNFVNYLSDIVRFGANSEENRKFLAKIDGFVVLLVNLLDNNTNNVDAGVFRNVKCVELVVVILDSIVKETENYDQLSNLMMKNHRDCFSSMRIILQQGSIESKIASTKLLEYSAIDARTRQTIAEKDDILTELLKSINPEKDPILIEASLSCLIAISTARRTKLTLSNLGIIKKLSDLLSDSNSRVSIIEKVLKLLQMTSTCKEARREMCENSELVAEIVRKILKVSSAATEHAMATLWSMCWVFREQNAQETVMKSNGLTKVLLLMQSNCSPSVRLMCVDLLKIFKIGSKSCLFSYDTKATHIMPF